MNSQPLFFKSIEEQLSPEKIASSKSEFKDSFLPYGLTPKKITEVADDVILDFEESMSSWKENFYFDLKRLFEDAQDRMEESYLKGEQHFHQYVKHSLSNITRIDNHNFSKPFINNLIKYFLEKYNIDFKLESYNVPTQIKLKHGLKPADLNELYNLSTDFYIDDTDFHLEDFVAFTDGKNTKQFKFKCSTAEMVEYVEHFLLLFEKSQQCEIGRLYHFVSKGGSFLSASNYTKYKSKRTCGSLLDEPLLSHFKFMQKKI